MLSNQSKRSNDPPPPFTKFQPHPLLFLRLVSRPFPRPVHPLFDLLIPLRTQRIPKALPRSTRRIGLSPKRRSLLRRRGRRSRRRRGRQSRAHRRTGRFPRLMRPRKRGRAKFTNPATLGLVLLLVASLDVNLVLRRGGGRRLIVVAGVDFWFAAEGRSMEALEEGGSDVGGTAEGGELRENRTRELGGQRCYREGEGGKRRGSGNERGDVSGELGTKELRLV